MKRYVFFSFLLLFVSCVKHDEIPFKGTIVDTRECNASFGQHQEAGFVVSLTTPDSIGKPYTHSGVTYSNSVIKYSRANCSIHWSDFDIPEGVFVDVSVE